MASEKKEKSPLETVVESVAGKLRDIWSALDGHEARIKKVEDFQKSVDSGARRSITAERKKQLKKEGEEGEE